MEEQKQIPRKKRRRKVLVSSKNVVEVELCYNPIVDGWVHRHRVKLIFIKKKVGERNTFLKFNYHGKRMYSSIILMVPYQLKQGFL